MIEEYPFGVFLMVCMFGAAVAAIMDWYPKGKKKTPPPQPAGGIPVANAAAFDGESIVGFINDTRWPPIMKNAPIRIMGAPVLPAPGTEIHEFIKGFMMNHINRAVGSGAVEVSDVRLDPSRGGVIARVTVGGSDLGGMLYSMIPARGFPNPPEEQPKKVNGYPYPVNMQRQYPVRIGGYHE